MKKKISILLVSLVVSTLSVFFIAPAEANDCNASNPCGTWAVVNDQGVVVNIIVCQQSVCGSGSFGGMRVVEQSKPDPVTHQSTGGVMTSPEQDVLVTESDGVFTVKRTEPEVIKIKENVDPIEEDSEKTITVEIEKSVTKETFTSENPDLIKTTEITDESNATITVQDDENNTIETIVFEERKTEQEVLTIINDQSLQVIKRNVQRILNKLYAWIAV